MINIANFIRVFIVSQSLPIITMLALFILILFITSYFYFVYKKEKQFEKAQEKIQDNYDNILLEAHKKAREIITEAAKKARDILSTTQFTQKEAEEKLQEGLQKETTEALGSLTGSIDAIEQSALNYVKGMADQTGKLTQQELATFRDNMQKELVQTKMRESQQLSDLSQKAAADIEAYKQAELQKVKDKISQIVVKVAEDVIGRAISLQDHEKLVLESLEQAKQEGFFD